MIVNPPSASTAETAAFADNPRTVLFAVLLIET
jgi:hypothetical protein